MPLQRKIDWIAARLDRLAREAACRRLVVAGSYDRSAIMTAALAQARAQRAKGSKAPWSQLVGAPLRFVWARAKAVCIAGAH
jgi:hypothetical protein